jgi:hypothetical protein
MGRVLFGDIVSRPGTCPAERTIWNGIHLTRKPQANNVLWGNDILNGNAILWGNNLCWGNAILWGNALAPDNEAFTTGLSVLTTAQ